ncbi:MAG: NAD(P)/FAD-dependent oxidoreductase [Alphaproteobacteria bacterium]
MDALVRERTADADTRLHDVCIIGAGFGGLCMAIKAREIGLDVLLLERGDDVGGTWRDNIYPGAACDTQSHHYSFSFAPKTDWSRKFAPQPEILDYIRDTARSYDIYPLIRFSEVARSMVFDEENAEWHVTTESGSTVRARFLVSAVGLLNQASYPDIPGLKDFPGNVAHSAEWDPTVDHTGKTVAVVGSAASAVQMVPELAKVAKKVLVFQRTPNWIASRDDLEFSAWQKWVFKYVPLAQRIYRYTIYWQWERSWPEFLDKSPQSVKSAEKLKTAMRKQVNSEKLADAITPSYPLGCKRILVTDDFLPALCRDNVELVTDPIDRVEDGNIVVATGDRYAADNIALATGFKVQDFLPRLSLQGRGGRNFHAEMKAAGGPEAYLGITVPGYPNLFFIHGPNTSLGHNSVVFMLECQVNYIMDAIRQARKRGASTIEVTQEAKDAFYNKLKTAMQKTAWAGSCNSWYKTSDGKITANWYTHTVEYWRQTRKLKTRDYSFR